MRLTCFNSTLTKPVSLAVSTSIISALILGAGSGFGETPQTAQIKPQAVEAKGELTPVFKRLNKEMHLALRGAIQHQRRDLGPLIIFEQGKMKLMFEAADT